jgi:hypothetical protein
MGVPVASRANAPGPLRLIVLPPGLAAVPRSTEPPVTLTATWSKPVLSWTTSFRRTRRPPVTRMVGASVALVNVEPVMTRVPESRMRAGDPP